MLDNIQCRTFSNQQNLNFCAFLLLDVSLTLILKWHTLNFNENDIHQMMDKVITKTLILKIFFTFIMSYFHWSKIYLLIFYHFNLVCHKFTPTWHVPVKYAVIFRSLKRRWHAFLKTPPTMKCVATVDTHAFTVGNGSTAGGFFWNIFLMFTVVQGK